MSGSGEGGQREVAYRLFATEYEDADLSYSESDEERAPNYVITPSGARVNRLFVVGVLTEVEQVSEDVLRGRVVDPTGAFVLYAGQYQPDEMAFLEGAQVPAFVAVTGKARTFQPEDSKRVYTSVRPESINEVDTQTRDRWLVRAAEHTLDRIGYAAEALSRDERGDELGRMLADSGASDGLAAGIPVAIDHYGTTPAYLAALRDVAIDVARVVAGTRDEVSPLDVRPDEPGDATADDLRGLRASTGDRPGTRSEPETDDGTTRVAGSEPATADDTARGGESGPIEHPPVESTSDTTSEETTIDDGPETTSDGDRQGTVDTGDGTPDVGGEGAEDSLGDFDPGEYELEAETREEIEAEFGTDFQTGTEVDDPGEADIQTENGGDEPVESEVTETEQAAGEQPEDLQAVVVDLMHELDDGTGADRAELVAQMADRHGTDEDAVEDAIQDALMDGQCYEPDETTLKPI